MAGLVPAIHAARRIERPQASIDLSVFAAARADVARLFINGAAWMAGTSPAMTAMV